VPVKGCFGITGVCGITGWEYVGAGATVCCVGTFVGGATVVGTVELVFGLGGTVLGAVVDDVYGVFVAVLGVVDVVDGVVVVLEVLGVVEVVDGVVVVLGVVDVVDVVVVVVEVVGGGYGGTHGGGSGRQPG
jgi:hypothetical protein